MSCSLPSDVWYFIFKHLSQRELISIIFLSRDAKKVVETFLYQEPEIRLHTDDMTPTLVDQFHQAVMKDDGLLANYVHTLTIKRGASRRIEACVDEALLLALRNLRRLRVQSTYGEVAPPSVSPSSQFSNITHLVWRTDVRDQFSFAAFLEALPGLEYLGVWADELTETISLAPSALPLLRHLEQASFDFAASILPGRQIHHLGLYTDYYLPPQYRSLSPSLKDAHQHVQSLDMVSKFIPEYLMAYVASFRQLRYLKVRSYVSLAHLRD